MFYIVEYFATRHSYGGMALFLCGHPFTNGIVVFGLDPKDWQRTYLSAVILLIQIEKTFENFQFNLSTKY